MYHNRFEIISYDENLLESAQYLTKMRSKGASEIFAIKYAFNNSRFIDLSNFIIKITGRYFIDELEEYLSHIKLNEFDSLTQNNKNRCEMVGCHKKNFDNIFELVYNDNCMVEKIWNKRISQFKKTVKCKVFKIKKTQRGGINKSYNTI